MTFQEEVLGFTTNTTNICAQLSALDGAHRYRHSGGRPLAIEQLTVRGSLRVIEQFYIHDEDITRTIGSEYLMENLPIQIGNCLATDASCLTLAAHEKWQLYKILYAVTHSQFPQIFIAGTDSGDALQLTRTLRELGCKAIFVLSSPKIDLNRVGNVHGTTMVSPPIPPATQNGQTDDLVTVRLSDLEVSVSAQMSQDTTILQIQEALLDENASILSGRFGVNTIGEIHDGLMRGAIENSDAGYIFISLNCGINIPNQIVGGVLKDLVSEITKGPAEQDEKNKMIGQVSSQAGKWKELVSTYDRLKGLTSDWSGEEKKVLAQCMRIAEEKIGYTEHRQSGGLARMSRHLWGKAMGELSLTGRHQWVIKQLGDSLEGAGASLETGM